MGRNERSLGWFTDDESRGLMDFWAVLSGHLDELVRELVLRAASLQRVRGAAPPGIRAPFEQVLHCWAQRDLEKWQDAERAINDSRKTLQARGITLDDWCNLFASTQAQLTRLLIDAYEADAARLGAALSVLQRYVLGTTNIVARGFLSDKDVELRSERGETLRAKTRFTRLMESGLLGVIVCDYEGNVLEANDSFLDKFGYSQADLAAGHVRWMSMTPPEWAALDQQAIAQLREQGKAGPWEKEYFHRDGRRVSVLVGVATLSGSETIAFVLDLNDSKRVEQMRLRNLELEVTSRRNQEASRSKARVLASKAQELRTSLDAILDVVQAVRDQRSAPGSAQLEDSLEKVRSSGRGLHLLVDDLLELAGPEPE